MNSLKFQFVTLFTLFIIVSVGISAVVGTRATTQITMKTFSKMGFQIAERAVAVIDGDSFEALSKSLDAEDPSYEATRERLFQIKELSGCLYLYTLARIDKDDWRFIIDGSDEPGGDLFSGIGDKEDVSTYDDAFWETYNTGKPHIGKLTDQGEWGKVISVYTPVKNSRGTVVGVVGCDFDGAFLEGSIESEETDQVIIAGISVIIGLILLMFFMRRIFTPLGKVNAILAEISHGEGDVTRRITNYRDDEIGTLAVHVNTTLDKIKDLIVSIKNETNSSFEAGNDLADNMQQTAETVDQIAAVIQTVEQKVTSQSASVNQTGATMEHVTNSIDKLRQNVEVQTESVSRSSAAIEEMLANVQRVTNTLIDNEANVRELITVSDAGRASLQKVSQDIQEIARESEGLLEINTVMENIASQTNLLSMNAAIEAAHAGESGKGFAVVANEIRKLAVDSSNQSKTISEVLKRIKTAIDTMTGSTNTVLAKFQAIAERVNTVSVQETSIRNAMEEQGRGSKQILEAVARMNDLTQKVKQGTVEMFEDSREVIHESKNLEQITVEISDSVNTMASGAKQMNAAVNRVNEISKTNKNHLSTLFTEVSRFKVA